MSRQETIAQTLGAHGVTVVGGAPSTTLIPHRMGSVQNLKAHERGVNAVAFSPDGKAVASGGDDGTVRIWDLATGKEVQVLPVHSITVQPYAPPVRAVAFSPDGKTLASGADHDSVKLWDLSTGQIRSTLVVTDRNLQAVTSISFTPDGKKLAAAIARLGLRTLPCEVIVWDLATSKEVCTIEGGLHSSPVVAFVPPDEKALGLSGGGGTRRGITIHDAMTGAQWADLLTPNCHMTGAMAISPDGTIIASVEWGFTTQPVTVPYYQLVLWKTDRGTVVAISEAQTELITSLTFSPDGKLLASGSWMGTITFWDAATMGKRMTIGYLDPALTVAFSPDGRLLASGHISGTVAFWGSPAPCPPSEIPKA